MDFMTSAMLSGIVYDMVKRGVGMSMDSLKSRLNYWLVDDNVIKEMSTRLNELNINESMSERAIQEHIERNESLMKLMQNIKPNQSILVHHGSGDNVAGDKIINN